MNKKGLIKKNIDRNQPLSAGFLEVTENIHVCEGIHNYSNNLEE